MTSLHFPRWFRRRAEWIDAYECGKEARRLLTEARAFDRDADVFRAMEAEAVPVSQRVAEEHADFRAEAERLRDVRKAQHDALVGRWCHVPGFLDGYKAGRPQHEQPWRATG